MSDKDKGADKGSAKETPQIDPEIAKKITELRSTIRENGPTWMDKND